MNLRVFVLVLAALIAAGGLAVHVSAESTQSVDRISYSQYGFEIAVPRGSVRIPAPAQAAQASSGFTEMFSCGGAVAVILIASAEGRDRNSLEAEMNKIAAKMGVGATSFTTSQGVRFVGASGILTLSKDMLQGMPPSIGPKPGMQVKQSMYAAPLPNDTNSVLALVFAGATHLSTQVDSLAQTVLNSVTFTGMHPGNNSALPQVKDQGTTLLPGQIALNGKVEAISAESKSLTMLADAVTAYGKMPVALSPARQKTINYSSPPEGVAAGSRILVIGPNSGAGKPMTAVTIVLEK